MSGLMADLVADLRRGRSDRRTATVAATTPRIVPWTTSYRRRLALSDAAAILVGCLVALALTMTHTLSYGVTGPLRDQALVASGVAFVWFASLTLSRTRDIRLLGQGAAEYQRVFEASWWLFATIAVFSYVFDVSAPRSLVLVAFPVGVVLLLGERYAWRQWLHHERAAGRCTRAVLAIGHRDQADRLIGEFNDRPQSGYRIIGVCVPSHELVAGDEIHGVPVLGDVRAAGALAVVSGAECVAVSGSDAITADVVRRLGWELESRGIDLMLTAELADVAGPRITVTPAESVSLVHVDAPRFTGPKFVVKTASDWLGATLALLVLAPLMAFTALAVATTSPGPVLYQQTRVGRNGKTFSMYKFRTMRMGADAEIDMLLGSSDGSGPLFKMREDPRVTPLGRLLRRYSIDELPQLFNVLRGEMSMVGPRPPLPTEVSAYEDTAQRRLLVKPGLTGLWQVGGRSDLSWAESVRLDVYYVENWTIFVDLLLIVKTARAIVGGRGAY